MTNPDLQAPVSLTITSGESDSDTFYEQLQTMEPADRRKVLLEMVRTVGNAIDLVVVDDPEDLYKINFAATALALAVGSKGSRLARVINDVAGQELEEKARSAYRLLESAASDLRKHLRALEAVANPHKEPGFNLQEFISQRRDALREEADFQDQLRKATAVR